MSRSPFPISTPHGPAIVELLVCDGCQKMATPAAAIGWIEVSAAGVQVSPLGRPQFPVTVCGGACLADLARAMGAPGSATST